MKLIWELTKQRLNPDTGMLMFTFFFVGGDKEQHRRVLLQLSGAHACPLCGRR